MTRIQEKLNSLFGSEIKSINFSFRTNEININILILEEEAIEKYELNFGNVVGHELQKDWADEEWKVIGIAEIFYLPEAAVINEKKSKFNFMIDGDGFYLFINAACLRINNENVLV